MKLSLALLALAAAGPAASQHTATKQDSAPQTEAQAPEQGYAQQGYAQQGDAQQGDAQQGDAQVAPEDYAAPEVYMASPDICLSPCPPHAPCLNAATGSCTPKMFEPMYQPYGYAQEPTYAQGTAQGTAQQDAYRRLSSEGSCPHGTTDSSDLTVTKKWPLWTGFALLFIPSMWFMSYMFRYLTDDAAYNALTDLEKAKYLGRALKCLVAGFICMCASLAYLTMATGHGFITRCCDGRSMYYARYIDWAITTPMMLYELSTHAGDFSRKDVTLEVIYLVFVDVLMIVAGLIGALMCGNEKWAFFGFSMLCFIPILRQLCEFDEKVAGEDEDQHKTYKTIMQITVVSWFFYPIVWILAEGTNVLSANGEAIAYTTLDVIAKSFFGWIIVSNATKR